jgi:hypothetical protein
MCKEEIDMVRTQLFDAGDTVSLDMLIAKSEDHTPVDVVAVFDSSFDKVISVPADLAERLGLTVLGLVVDQAADSWAPQYVLAEANVTFVDQEKMVPVVVRAPRGRVVIGPGFLQRFKLRLIVDHQGTALVEDAEWRRAEKAQADWPNVEPSGAPVAPWIARVLGKVRPENVNVNSN